MFSTELKYSTCVSGKSTRRQRTSTDPAGFTHCRSYVRRSQVSRSADAGRPTPLDGTTYLRKPTSFSSTTLMRFYASSQQNAAQMRVVAFAEQEHGALPCSEKINFKKIANLKYLLYVYKNELNFESVSSKGWQVFAVGANTTAPFSTPVSRSATRYCSPAQPSLGSMNTCPHSSDTGTQSHRTLHYIARHPPGGQVGGDLPSRDPTENANMLELLCEQSFREPTQSDMPNAHQLHIT